MSVKDESVDHENKIAKLYGGKRSPSSGASIRDKFDVETERDYFECKSTGRPGTNKKAKLVRLMEEITDSARERGREGALSMRFFDPDSLLADVDGYVYLTVRLTRDDRWREPRD